MPMPACLAVPVTAAVLLACAALCAAHSFLVVPPAFNTKFATRDCRAAECVNACPRLERPGDMANTVESPAAVWERGQEVQVCWARNNHHGGITRLTLVPVNVMNKREYHDKFTIMKTCWDAGAVRCRQERIPCGTDKKTAFCRTVEIPHVFPNGDYVLGYQWYGGVHFKKKRGWFPDFYSCAFIRIHGGSLRCNRPFTQFFKPGSGKEVNKRGECLTSADRLGLCENRGCRNKKATFTKPFPFNSNRKKDQPEPFSCEDIREARKVHTAAVNMLMGHCHTKVCCDKRCGLCGGNNCDRAPGGGKKCCVTPVLKSRRSCERYEPPCVRPDYKIIRK